MNAFRTVANNVATNWQKSRLQLRRVWALSLPFFQSEEKWHARLLLGACVGLNLGMVYMMVLLNDWNRVFYDALQNRNAEVFWKQLGVFAPARDLLHHRGGVPLLPHAVAGSALACVDDA